MHHTLYSTTIIHLKQTNHEKYLTRSMIYIRTINSNFKILLLNTVVAFKMPYGFIESRNLYTKQDVVIPKLTPELLNRKTLHKETQRKELSSKGQMPKIGPNYEADNNLDYT